HRRLRWHRRQLAVRALTSGPGNRPGKSMNRCHYARGMARLRVVAAQINVTVGDLAGNVERIVAGIEAAEAAGADLVAFPELAVSGYPPEDLLLRPAFVAEAQRALEKVATRTGQTVAVVGFPLAERDLYNASAVCAGGTVRGLYRKWLLPN